MGDKIHSKVIARKAKVSMIPGYDGEVKDEDECIRVSNDIGTKTNRAVKNAREKRIRLVQVIR